MLTKKQILASIQKSLISYKKDVLDSLYSKVNHTHSEYVNPSCYGSIKVGSNTVSAGSSQDTLTFTNGTGISLGLASPSASEDKITITNSGVRSIATGSSNGTISVNTNGKSADVAVKGLGSAAYTNSNSYATSSHTHKYAGSSSAGGVATEAAKVSHSLQISGNGGLLGMYDGSADKIVDITPSVIGAATSSHTHTSMGVNDTRNNNENPTALCANSQIRADFKMPSKIKLTGSSASYVGTITFRPFGSASDWSGGKATQLAFADEGNVFMRKGTGTTWSDWTQFYTSSNKPKASDIGAAASSHTHKYAGSSSAGGVATEAAKTTGTLTIQGNGKSLGTFNGSANKTVNITASNIGAAASSHTHNYAGSSSAGGAATSANKVNSTLTIQGNGTQLTTFNGSANKTVNITPSSIGATTESYVNTAINNALGDIATILTEINGE